MSIFELLPQGSATQFSLQVTPDLCVGMPELRFVFGGTVLGAAVTAIERAAQRPIVWATAQFLSHAGPGTRLDIDVDLSTVGRFNTQARATGRIGDRTVFLATAALGARPHETSMQWLTAPEVLPPEACADDFFWPETARMLKEKVEILHALPARGGRGLAKPGSGRMILWIRSRDDMPLDSALIAIIGDFATAGVSDALGPGFIGNSLDNTIRVCQVVPTRWMLCDVQLHGTHVGFAHGEMRMFAETGELVAIASQSMILRSVS